MSNDGIAWLALVVSTVSAGTAVWALVETYRHRPRPELVVEWDPATVVNLGGGHAWVYVTNQAEATALDVRVSVDLARDIYGNEWLGPERLGPGEGMKGIVPLYAATRGTGAHGTTYPPANGFPPMDQLVRPTIEVRWRQEPNTKKVRTKRYSAPDSVLPKGAAFRR